jgi:hypothetical protein
MLASMESDLVTVCTFASESEATIAKGALEAFGVDCMVSHDDCGGQRPHLTLTGGIRLLVRALDTEKAKQVLSNNSEQSTD